MLENLKLMLGIDDADLDGKLELILLNAEKRLKRLLGGVDAVPAELQDIVLEASVIRFNRIGSEGLKVHSVEGESLTFADDDFSGFMDDIQAWLNVQEESSIGKVRFI